jgi:hypothetical protein
LQQPSLDDQKTDGENPNRSLIVCSQLIENDIHRITVVSMPLNLSNGIIEDRRSFVETLEEHTHGTN